MQFVDKWHFPGRGACLPLSENWNLNLVGKVESLNPSVGRCQVSGGPLWYPSSHISCTLGFLFIGSFACLLICWDLGLTIYPRLASNSEVLLQPPEYWNFRCDPPCLTSLTLPCPHPCPPTPFLDKLICFFVSIDIFALSRVSCELNHYMLFLVGFFCLAF